MKRHVIRIAIVLLAMVFIAGCAEEKAAPKKKLLVYVGATMIKPMTEIAKAIEEQENCEIVLSRGGSGHLLKTIKSQQIGDLYLPGSDSYIKTCLEDGLVTDTVFVGYNKAAMMVQEGNPKSISADLENLTKKEYKVSIVDPKAGSIGKEAKKILEKKGIYDQVVANVDQFGTADSGDLILMLKDKKVDLVINWFATSAWPDNRDFVDPLPIDDKYAKKKKLVIGLLKTSENPEIARKFMEYAGSEKGRELFTEYGLYDVK